MQPQDMAFNEVKQAGGREGKRERTTVVQIHKAPTSPVTQIPCSPNLNDSGSRGYVCVSITP